MHNIAARIAARPPHDHDIGKILQSLHWLPLKSHILVKSLHVVLLLVYKYINNLASKYVSSILVSYKHERCGLKLNAFELLSVIMLLLNSTVTELSHTVLL